MYQGNFHIALSQQTLGLIIGIEQYLQDSLGIVGIVWPRKNNRHSKYRQILTSQLHKKNVILVVKGADSVKDNTSAIQRIVEWINNNPETMPTEIEASQSVRYDPSYLSKLFKQSTGITFRAYSTIIKMGYAAAELRDTEIPIFEIADRLGYSDAAAFSHAFANACGCSPTDYRKNPDSIPMPFFKIIPATNKGVITMKKIDPANVIGDAFVKLLELQPASIIMYCLLASFSVSPTGMLQDYNPSGNKLPCIEIDSSVAEMLPLSIDEIFQAIIELADVDLLTIVNMENNSFHVVINPIPDKLVSNGTLESFVDFLKAQKDR